MSRFFLDVSYEGTHYLGWQVQSEGLTVQGEINKQLSKILNQEIETSGGSRTDTGVHARQSFCHFDMEQDIPEHFIQRINKMLPPDISINKIHSVAEDAHVRFDASSRTYEYIINYAKNPFRNNKSYYYPHPALDIEAMNKAASVLLRHIDYTAFSKMNTQVKTNNCSIIRAEWIAQDDGLSFWVESNRFLRGMVRGLVGTMILVGRGKMTAEEFEQLIISKDQSQTDFSAPACGLFLDQVKYPYLK